MGVEDSPFLPYCSKWKDLGKEHKQKYRSSDWTSFQGLQGKATLPKLSFLPLGPSTGPPNHHALSASLPDSRTLQFSVFADKYKRFIPQENLEVALAAAKAVEKSVVLPPLNASSLNDVHPEIRKEWNEKVALLPLRRPFDPASKEGKMQDGGTKRQRVGDSLDHRKSVTSVFKTAKSRRTATDDDRLLSYVLGPPLYKALVALAQFEAKTISTQGLVRVEAVEVEHEECYEVAAEQERVRLEQELADYEQRKHKQRLQELSEVRTNSLNSNGSARPSEVSASGTLPFSRASLFGSIPHSCAGPPPPDPAELAPLSSCGPVDPPGLAGPAPHIPAGPGSSMHPSARPRQLNHFRSSKPKHSTMQLALASALESARDNQLSEQQQQQQLQQVQDKQQQRDVQNPIQGGLKRIATQPAEPASNTARFGTDHVQTNVQDGDEPPAQKLVELAPRMQRYVQRVASFKLSSAKPRRTSFAGNLLDSPSDGNSPKPSRRQSGAGLDAVLQPKLACVPSLAACRRLSKRHTWFGVEEGHQKNKGSLLLSDVQERPHSVSSKSSEVSGVELNAALDPNNPLAAANKNRDKSSTVGSDVSREDVALAGGEKTHLPKGSKMPYKEWPRLKPRVSVIASVLAAGAALGIPAIIESPSGPPDVAAVAVVWAAWAREPENTKSHLVVPIQVDKEGNEEGVPPRTSLTLQTRESAEALGLSPFIQLPQPDGSHTPPRPVTPLTLPSSHHLLQELLQPHPRRNIRLCGVSLSFLVTLGGLLIAELGPQQAWQLSTQDVSEWLLQPLTLQHKCSISELLPDEAVGLPQHYVSHRYEGPFLSLVSALANHFSTDSTAEVYLWVDFLATNPFSLHARNPCMQVGVVRDMIRSTHSTLLVLDSEGKALSRTWVLFEAWCSCIPSIPGVTEPLQATECAPPTSPGAPKLVLLLPHGSHTVPMLAKALKHVSIIASEAASPADFEAMLDQMRKISISLAAYLTKLELLELPEYKRMAKEYFLKAEHKDGHGTKALDPMVQASMLTQDSLLQCVQAEQRLVAQKLDSNDMGPLVLSATIRRSEQLGALLLLFGKPGEVVHLLSRAVILTVDGHQGDLCVADLTCAATTLIHAMLEQGRVRSAVIIARKLYEAMGRLLPKHPAVPTVAFALHAALNKGLQYTSSEIVARTTLRRLERLHIQLHPHLQQLHFLSSRPSSARSNGSGAAAGKHAGIKSAFSSLKEHFASKSGSITGNQSRPETTSELSDVIDSSRQIVLSKPTVSSESVVTPTADADAGSFAAITTLGGLTWWWGFDGALGQWGERETDIGGRSGATQDQTGEVAIATGECDDGRRHCIRVEVAHAAWMLGASLHAQRRWDEAEILLLRTALLLQSALGERHPFFGLVLNLLGEVAAGKQDHLEASSCFMQARPLLLSGFTRDSATWINATVKLAASLQALGDLDTAEKMIRRLLRPPVSLRTLSPMMGQTLSAAPPPAQQADDSPSQQVSADEGLVQIPGPAADAVQAQQDEQLEGHEAQRHLELGQHDNSESEDDNNAQVDQSAQVKEWLMNEDEQALDKRLAGQSYPVLCQLAKLLIARTVTKPFRDPLQSVLQQEQLPRVLGRGPVVWSPEAKAFTRVPKVGTNLHEALADVRVAMDRRSKGQHYDVEDHGDEGKGANNGVTSHKQDSTLNELPMRKSGRGLSFAGETEMDDASKPPDLKALSSNPTYFPGLSMLIPQHSGAQERASTLAVASEIEAIMTEAMNITGRLLTRLQEALQNSKISAEADAVARLRAHMQQGDGGPIKTRRQLRGQNTMVAHDYALKLRNVNKEQTSGSKSGGVGWDAEVSGGKDKTSSKMRDFGRRGSLGGDASRGNSRGSMAAWSDNDEDQESISLPDLVGRSSNGSKKTGGRSEHQKEQQPARSTRMRMYRDGFVRGPAGAQALLGQVRGRTDSSISGPLRHLQAFHEVQPGSSRSSSPKRSHDSPNFWRTSAKHAPSRPASSKRLPSAKPQRSAKALHSNAHKDERKVVVQDERKTVADIPAAIATAAGLAAEAAKREGWKQLALQVADIYMAHARQLHAGAEVGAAIMALQAAVSIYKAMGSLGSNELLKANNALIDMLLCSRRFVEARQVLVSHESSFHFTTTEKAALRQMVEEKATEHLFRAAAQGDEELAFWTLELGAKACKPTLAGMQDISNSLLLPMASALVSASSQGHLATSAVIVAMAPQSIEEIDGVTSMRPLSMAASLGNVGLTNLFLDHKAHVDALDQDGKTALMHAAHNGHSQVVSVIIHRGRPSLNLKESKNGMTALMLASERGHAKAVWALLDGLAGTGMLDSNSRTALMWAAMGGHAEVAEALLSKGGTRTNAKDADGNSALSHACLSGQLECVQILIDHKADLRIFDNNKQTPLHKASIVANPEVLSLLLMERPEVSLRDLEGRNALHLAAANNNSVHCALLVYYVARNAEMAGGSTKPLVILPHLHFNIKGRVDGVNSKIGSKVDNTLKGKQAARKDKGAAASSLGNQLYPLALYEASRLKAADEAYAAHQAQKADAQQTLSESQPGIPQMPAPPLPSRQQQQRQQHTPLKQPHEGHASRHTHSPAPQEQDGAGVQSKGHLNGIECQSAPSPRSQQSTPSLSGSQRGTPSSAQRPPGTPGSEEPPITLELLLPYATLPQVRFFMGATDKFGSTPTDAAAAAGHIHLAKLLHAFMVYKAP